jgi:low affinity Fe/Cu permease
MPENSNTPSTDSKPLRERLLPQTSIRFLMLAIVLSAIVMVIFREALVGGSAWAKVVALLIQTGAASFIAYTCMFLIANVFSATTQPLIEVIESKIDESREDQP